MDNKVSAKNVIMLSGAFCAYFIGAGFASGQEIMQMYTAFGLKGFLGIGFSVLVMCYVAYQVQAICRTYREYFKEPSDVLMYYFGTKIGKVFIWFLIVILIGECIMMASGAGAIFEQYFGLPTWTGRAFILIITGFTVALGLQKLLDVLGVAGPLIILFMVIVAVAAIIKAPATPAEASAMIQAGIFDITRGGSNWFIASILYAGNIIITTLPIWIINGTVSNSVREAKVTAITGVMMFLLACGFMVVAQMSNIELIAGVQIPNLLLGSTYVPKIASVFAIILILGVYTTIAGETWYIIRKFAKEKTATYYIAIAIFAVIVFLITGLAEFDVIVNILYKVSFWLGILLGIVMTVRLFMRMAGHSVDNKYLEAIKKENENKSEENIEA